MKKILATIAFLLFIAFPAFAQVGIQMTKAGDTCSDRFANPVQGRSVCFEADTNRFAVWDGSAWVYVTVPDTGLLGAANGGTGIDTSSSTGTPNLSSGIWSVGDLQTKSYAVASLPAASAGLIARITDGDAAGSLVIADGTNWRCLSELTEGKINIACPPYNATAAASDNSTAIAAACAAFFADETDPKRYIFWPNGDYTTTSPIDCKDDDSNLHLVIRGVIGGHSRLTCNYSGTGSGQACLEIGSTSTWNHLDISWLNIRGQGTIPQYLLAVTGGFQINLQHIWIQNYASFGLLIRNSGHVLLDHFLCIADSTATSTSACVVADDSDNVIITHGDAEDADTTTRSIMIQLDGSTETANIAIVDNSAKASVFVDDINSPTFKHLIIANNTINKAYSCIKLNNAPAINEPIITGNACSFYTSGTPASGDVGISLDTATGGTIADNTISGFYTGINSKNNVDNIFRDIVIDSTADNCVEDMRNDVGNKWIRIRITGQCGGDVLNVASGTATGGNNQIDGFILGDAATKGDGITTTLTNWLTTDNLELADMPQTITIADSGDANPATGTTVPYYRTAILDCDDSSGGCIWQPGDTGISGAVVKIKWGTTEAAQPVKVSVDGGTNCWTPTATSGPAFIYYTGDTNKWSFAPSTSTAGC